MTRHQKKPCPHKRLYEAAQQRRRQREQEAVEALMLLRAGFGEFGLWGNVPGNVPGTLPLQWQSNWQPFPGSRPVSFGPVAVGGSNPQTTNPSNITTITRSANTNTRGNIPSGTSSGYGHSHNNGPTTSAARLNTLATVAADSRPLPLPAPMGRVNNRPLQDRANGSTSARESTRARSRAPSPEGPRRAQAPSPEGQRRSPAPSPEDPGYRGPSR